MVSASSMTPSARCWRPAADESVKLPIFSVSMALVGEPVGVVSAGVGIGFLGHPAKITVALMSTRHSFREVRFIECTRQE
jgi:hypothetical protein